MTRRHLWFLTFLLAAACAGKAGSPSQEGPGGGDPNGCAQEISLSCSAGFVDGCLEKGKGGPLTLSHVCVREGSKSGPTCDKEVAQTCPEDQVDACSVSPAAATTHVCVVPVPTP